MHARAQLEDARREGEARLGEQLAAVQASLVEVAGEQRAQADEAEAAARRAVQAAQATIGAAEERMREEIAAAAKTEDLAAAAQKLTEEMRWLDEEHMRCRAEDEAKMLAAVQGLREELTESHQALQRAVVEGVIEDGQPGALSLLQQNESRVASLADAVTALNVHMETMRVKEVTGARHSTTHHSPLTTHRSPLTTHHLTPSGGGPRRGARRRPRGAPRRRVRRGARGRAAALEQCRREPHRPAAGARGGGAAGAAVVPQGPPGDPPLGARALR